MFPSITVLTFRKRFDTPKKTVYLQQTKSILLNKHLLTMQYNYLYQIKARSIWKRRSAIKSAFSLICNLPPTLFPRFISDIPRRSIWMIMCVVRHVLLQEQRMSITGNHILNVAGANVKADLFAINDFRVWEAWHICILENNVPGSISGILYFIDSFKQVCAYQWLTYVCSNKQ